MFNIKRLNIWSSVCPLIRKSETRVCPQLVVDNFQKTERKCQFSPFSISQEWKFWLPRIKTWLLQLKLKMQKICKFSCKHLRNFSKIYSINLESFQLWFPVEILSRPFKTAFEQTFYQLINFLRSFPAKTIINKAMERAKEVFWTISGNIF